MDLGDTGGGNGGRETVVMMYYMKEESIFNKNQKMKMKILRAETGMHENRELLNFTFIIALRKKNSVYLVLSVVNDDSF